MKLKKDKRSELIKELNNALDILSGFEYHELIEEGDESGRTKMLFEEALDALASTIELIETNIAEDIVEFLESKNRESYIYSFMHTDMYGEEYKYGYRMLSTLKEGCDLYSPSLEKYIFVCNKFGSVAIHEISKEDIYTIMQEAIQNNCPIYSLLGKSKEIYEDVDSPKYNEDFYSNKDICDILVDKANDWVIMNTYKEEKQ